MNYASISFTYTSANLNMLTNNAVIITFYLPYLSVYRETDWVWLSSTIGITIPHSRRRQRKEPISKAYNSSSPLSLHSVNWRANPNTITSGLLIRQSSSCLCPSHSNLFTVSSVRKMLFTEFPERWSYSSLRKMFFKELSCFRINVVPAWY